MKNFIKYLFLLTVLPVCCMACEEEGTGWNPSMIPDDPELPQPGPAVDCKAPLYWSVYEYCREAEIAGDKAINMSDTEWDRVIDWVAENLKPYGYDMLCTDGFMAMTSDISLDASGYMTTYGTMPLRTLIAKAKAKGLKIGIYDNPLWLHGPDETLVEGTNITFGSLRYNDALDRDVVLYP
ncbi:MAG: glucan 1,6-alpha-isomaltosidase, partial [Alistipes sp.]|nr:glucan 1,6-alpha-isomaltosidase [Alistipes sp.]